MLMPATPTRIIHGTISTSANTVRMMATTNTGNSVTICLTAANMSVSESTAPSIHMMPRRLSCVGR